MHCCLSCSTLQLTIASLHKQVVEMGFYHWISLPRERRWVKYNLAVIFIIIFLFSLLLSILILMHCCLPCSTLQLTITSLHKQCSMEGDRSQCHKGIEIHNRKISPYIPKSKAPWSDTTHDSGDTNAERDWKRPHWPKFSFLAFHQCIQVFWLGHARRRWGEWHWHEYP